MTDPDKTHFTIAAIIVIISVGMIGYGFGYLHGKPAEEVTNCKPPQTEWQNIHATLKRDKDGVLHLVCTPHEISGWGVK